MKIVQFRDGTYGIQKGIFFKKYVDLYDPEFSWIEDTYTFNVYCKGMLRVVKRVYLLLTNKYWKGEIKVIDV